jgi:hypothetical protein
MRSPVVLFSLCMVVLAAASLGAGEPVAEIASGSGLIAGPTLPVSGLFAGSAGAGLVPTEHRFNFDLSVGPFIPIEGKEDYDVGGTIDLKLQGEVVRYFFVGGEFAYAGHDKNDVSRVFYEGSLNRFFFLVPLELDLPFFGAEENPMSVRFGVAPGLQLVDPVVSDHFEDLAFSEGVRIEEDTIVAFDVRLRVGLRIPVGPHFGFTLEAAYDWAEATGETRERDAFTGEELFRSRGHVNLSGVSVLLGIQIVW